MTRLAIAFAAMLLGGLALTLGAARADPREGHRWHWHGWCCGYVYAYPTPVYVAPPPVIYLPPAVVYAPYVAVAPPAVSFGFGLSLR